MERPDDAALIDDAASIDDAALLDDAPAINAALIDDPAARRAHETAQRALQALQRAEAAMYELVWAGPDGARLGRLRPGGAVLRWDGPVVLQGPAGLQGPQGPLSPQGPQSPVLAWLNPGGATLAWPRPAPAWQHRPPRVPLRWDQGWLAPPPDSALGALWPGAPEDAAGWAGVVSLGVSPAAVAPGRYEADLAALAPARRRRRPGAPREGGGGRGPPRVAALTREGLRRLLLAHGGPGAGSRPAREAWAARSLPLPETWLDLLPGWAGQAYAAARALEQAAGALWPGSPRGRPRRSWRPR